MTVAPFVSACLSEPRIVSETDDYVAVEKPHGMKTAPLTDDESDTLLSWVLEHCPECVTVSALKDRPKREYGLLHRLDTATHGLVLVAKTADFYNFMMQEQNAGRLVKTYRAETVQQRSMAHDGYPPCSLQLRTGTVISSAFRAYGEGRRAVRPVTDKSGRAARKDCTPHLYETRCLEVLSSGVSDSAARVTVRCSITRGFRHQIRCHLAWLGFPIVGDVLYGGADGGVLELHAEQLSFFYSSCEKQTIIAL